MVAEFRRSCLEVIAVAKWRLNRIDRDSVERWDKQLEALSGKVMIVTANHRSPVRLYEMILALRPEDPARG